MAEPIKDKLGRVIAKGDILARAEPKSYGWPDLTLYTVKEVASFAILISPVEDISQTKVIDGKPDVIVVRSDGE